MEISAENFAVDMGGLPPSITCTNPIHGTNGIFTDPWIMGI